MATLTLSLASCTAASGRPTIEKPGRPELTSTSTSTGNASIPNRLRLLARQTDISHNTYKPSPCSLTPPAQHSRPTVYSICVYDDIRLFIILYKRYDKSSTVTGWPTTQAGPFG